MEHHVLVLQDVGLQDGVGLVVIPDRRPASTGASFDVDHGPDIDQLVTAGLGDLRRLAAIVAMEPAARGRSWFAGSGWPACSVGTQLAIHISAGSNWLRLRFAGWPALHAG